MSIIVKRRKREYGEWVFVAEPAHYCTLPELQYWDDPTHGHGGGNYRDNLTEFPVGSIWRCGECSAEWELVSDQGQEFGKGFIRTEIGIR